jgi:DOPA 4,5-dioxygenase
LRDKVAAAFEVELGRWHDTPVGPHPCGSYQIAFGPELFATLVPWLALNRGDLTVFVHPNTGQALADHSAHVMWLGESRALNLDALR